MLEIFLAEIRLIGRAATVVMLRFLDLAMAGADAFAVLRVTLGAER